MLSIPLHLRRLSCLALAPFALYTAACSDLDTAPSSAGGGNTSGGNTSGGNAGVAGRSASAGADSDAGAAGERESDGGAAGSTEESAGAAGSNESAARGPAPVLLGSSSNYVILAKSAISNVPTSKIIGNMGLSPAAASYITEFSLIKAGTYWTSAQVVGKVFAADNDPPTPTGLTTAVADMETAYTDAATRELPDFKNLGAGTIGGLTLEPGLYTWGSSVTIPTDITLAGGANDVWIFQITGDLKLAEGKAMVPSGGAQAKHVFWQVAGKVEFGTTSHAEGVILAKTAITLGTGATINGRLLAQTAVSVAGSTVTAPAL